MSTRSYIAICKNRDDIEDGKFLGLYHHCDGYPSGVGSELSSILSECPLAWTPESVQKFINEYDSNYRIAKSEIGWDVEYVYVILCEEMLLCGYYKGITSTNSKWTLDDRGDELIIPDNIFTSEKPKEETKRPIWKSVNKKEQYPPCLTRWMDEYGDWHYCISEGKLSDEVQYISLAELSLLPDDMKK